MKTVKIRFSGFWTSFSYEDFFFYQILQKHFHVEVTEDADYVICSVFDRHSYVDCPQIRILFCGENITPDFNLVDYAISFYPISFLDRHYGFPGLLEYTDSFYELMCKDRNYPKDVLQEKPLFANFIASHDSDNGVRVKLFETANCYKRVEAAGSLCNNMPEGTRVDRFDGTKRALQKKCKFTLCTESTCHSGFITEKIFDAFCSDTVPVYYGSSTIAEIFNPKAFINVADYESVEAVVQRMAELDADDAQYLQMLREPVFNDPEWLRNKLTELEEFIVHIFDQPLEQARRRSGVYGAAAYEEQMRLSGKTIEKKPIRPDLRLRGWLSQFEFYQALSRWRHSL